MSNRGNDRLKKIAEGREAEIFAWEDGTVLRLMRRPGTEAQVDHQAQALAAAHAAGVNVPAAHGTTTVDGRPGLIMDRVDGPDMLTLLGRRPWWLFRVARVSGELHASLHEVVAPEHLPDLRTRLRGRISGSPLVPPQLAEFALRELDTLPDGDRLCHGDYHPGNVIETGGEPVVIDWTAVVRGDPTADYVRTNLMLHLGEPPPGAPVFIRVFAKFARSLLITLYGRAYRKSRKLDDELARRWQVPVAAARLVENITEEREKLIRLLERQLAES